VTIDWFVLLTPVLLALVALPFLFIGCSSFGAAEPETSSTPSPDSETYFILNLDSDLHDGVSPQVIVRVRARWTFSHSLDTNVLKLPHEENLVSRKVPPPVPPALDLSIPEESRIEWRRDSNFFGTRNFMVCSCDLFLDDDRRIGVRNSNAGGPLILKQTYTFRLRRRSGGDRYEVVFE
jgi:hypothetical protein